MSCICGDPLTDPLAGKLCEACWAEVEVAGVPAYCGQCCELGFEIHGERCRKCWPEDPDTVEELLSQGAFIHQIVRGKGVSVDFVLAEATRLGLTARSVEDAYAPTVEFVDLMVVADYLEDHHDPACEILRTAALAHTGAATIRGLVSPEIMSMVLNGIPDEDARFSGANPTAFEFG